MSLIQGNTFLFLDISLENILPINQMHWYLAWEYLWDIDIWSGSICGTLIFGVGVSMGHWYLAWEYLWDIDIWSGSVYGTLIFGVGVSVGHWYLEWEYLWDIDIWRGSICGTLRFKYVLMKSTGSEISLV